MRHHRVAPGEVVALRATDPAPGRFHRPGPPLERDRHHGIEAVELPEQVGPGVPRRGQERVQDHGLAVETEVTALRLELRKREPPVHTAPRRAVPHRARTVDQFGEKPRGFGWPQHLDRRVLRYERTARVHRRAKAGGGGLDLGPQVGGRAPSAALPPLHEPGGSSRCWPVGDRPETGIVRPDQVGLELLHPPGQKRTPLPLRDRYDAGALVVRGLGRGRATEHIEVEACVGVQTREEPLPAAQHAVDLFGRTPIHHRGLQPAGRDQLARAGQAGAAVLEPAPVGQLLGQRAGRLVVPELSGDPHRPLRITRCHGSSAHLPGSKRDG